MAGRAETVYPGVKSVKGGTGLRRRILSVLVCLAALAVMLGLGAAGRRNTADAIGIGVIMGEAVRVRHFFPKP